jgi:hypothetical protein
VPAHTRLDRQPAGASLLSLEGARNGQRFRAGAPAHTSHPIANSEEHGVSHRAVLDTCLCMAMVPLNKLITG